VERLDESVEVRVPFPAGDAALVPATIGGHLLPAGQLAQVELFKEVRRLHLCYFGIGLQQDVVAHLRPTLLQSRRMGVR